MFQLIIWPEPTEAPEEEASPEPVGWVCLRASLGEVLVKVDPGGGGPEHGPDVGVAQECRTWRMCTSIGATSGVRR